MPFFQFQNVNIGETDIIKVYKKKSNSAYEYDEVPIFTFHGRPAGSKEKKQYNVQKGVITTEPSLYLVSSNLPTEISDGDMIEFRGDKYIIKSVGYFIDEDLILNAGIMKPEYLTAHCLKGITI